MTTVKPKTTETSKPVGTDAATTTVATETREAAERERLWERTLVVLRWMRGHYKPLLVLFGLLVCFVALNYKGFAVLMKRWDSDSNYGHGYLIPFISLYFVWARKDELARLEPKPCMWGLALLLLGVLLAFFSMPLASSVASGVAIVVTLNALLLYLGGTQVYALLWLPALYLVFMVPLPQSVHSAIANPLQQFASIVSSWILSGVFDVFVERTGNVIRLIGHTLQVAEACSGMRSIMGLLALGVAFAYFWERPLWERIFLIVSAVPIAIVANICRVTGTGLMYHWGHERYAQGFYHEFTGLFVFVFAMALFLLEAWVLTHLFVYDSPPPTPPVDGDGKEVPA